jgi:hypothetical protein
MKVDLVGNITVRCDPDVIACAQSVHVIRVEIQKGTCIAALRDYDGIIENNIHTLHYD